MALDFEFESEDDGGDTLPDYLISANNHNLGNRNTDMFDGAQQRSMAKRAYNMVGSGVVSGLNSFYNTAKWAGNMFSDKDMEYRDARDVIASFDDDMAQYYDENRNTADLVGLVITSMVPGLGGVKVFQGGMKALTAAKEGVVGANLAKGLGILPGSRQALIKQASETFATSKLPFSYRNPDVMKAITAGFGQNVLESLAFETAVAVTMKKNPILTDLDFGQTLSNMMWGAGVGGAIGGTFASIGTVWGIKGGIKALDRQLAERGVTQLNQGVAGTRQADELLIIRNDIDTMTRNAPEGVSQEHYQRLVEDKLRAAENKSSKLMGELAGDEQLGNTLWNGIAADTTPNLGAKLLGLEGIRPLQELFSWLRTKKKWITESPELAPVKKGFTRMWYKDGDQFASVTKGQEATHWMDVPTNQVKLVPQIPAADGKAITAPTHSTRYMKLWGEGMGKISDELPSARHLADFGAITVRANAVQWGKSSIKINPGKMVDHSKLGYEEALARNIWAMDDTVSRLQVPKGKTELTVHQNDLAILTKAYREGFTALRIVGDQGEVLLQAPQKGDLLKFIAKRKDELTTSHMERALAEGIEESAERIANQYDTTLGFVTGEQFSQNLDEAVFGLKAAQKQWWNKFHANTPRPPALEHTKPWMKPQNYGMVYDNSTAHSINGFQVDAMAEIAARQEVYKAAAENAAADVLGAAYNTLPEISSAVLHGANRTGAGAGFISYTNAAYGSLGSFFEFIGAKVTRLVGEAKTKVTNTMTGVNYAILNRPEAGVEWAAIMQKVRAAGGYHYVMEGNDGLVLKVVRDYEEALANGKALNPPEIPAYVDERIAFQEPAVADWFKAHRDLNGARIEQRNTLMNAQGYSSNWDSEIIYSPAPTPTRFKYHAFVVDEKRLVGQQDTTMLYATDASTLEKQIAEAKSQGYAVYTPNDTADYFRARGLYEHASSLNESAFNASLRREGSSAPHFPLTGTPQEMLQDAMQWHAKEEGNIIRKAIETKYWKEFGILKQMGKDYDSLAKAQVGFLNKIKGGQIENPYENYIKLALGTSLKGDYPVWNTFNDFVETVGSKVWNGVSAVWRSSKIPTDADLDTINRIMKDYGFENAATRPQLEAWVNHPAGTAAVSEFVRTQNAILSTLILRLDPVNALNNAISSPILTLTETSSVLGHLAAGRTELMGELAELWMTKLPGTGDAVRSPAKLVARGYANFFSPEKAALLEKYKKMGVVTDLSTQIKNLMEEATIKGTETAAELEARRHKLVAMAAKLVDLGERGTGNRVAEELNRFVSANVMDQILEPYVRSGLMTEGVATTYINTFVNRTQGNVIASQRPQMFQGPVGQAIGLFQSYQFNIMQQLFRYVGEGSKKDALMLMGLQGTIFGLNGLPAFQAINQHIIGTASGNTNHVDAYTSVNNLVGKDIGDWLTYGLASNMFLDPNLKINLYSRGDISPRQLTVVPTDFADIPIVNAYSKIYQTLKGTAGTLANGGDVWNTLLSGIEQQGISRPMAGAARIARGLTNDGVSFSTSGKGNIISANEMYSLANLARLSGAKPFQEAIAQDAMFRYQAYQAKDTALRASLGKAIKSVVTGGGVPSEEQMNSFMESYAKAGGKQEEFSKWYLEQLRAATTPQVNKIMKRTDTAYGQYMQSIMGGRMLRTPQDVLNLREEQ